MGTLTNREDPDEMQHDAAFNSRSTLFARIITTFMDKKS